MRIPVDEFKKRIEGIFKEELPHCAVESMIGSDQKVIVSINDGAKEYGFVIKPSHV